MQSQLEWGQNKFIKFETKRRGRNNEKQATFEAGFSKQH